MHYEFRLVFIGSIALSLGLSLPHPAAAQAPAATGQQAVVTGQQAEASAAEERAQLENYVRVMKSELERAEARVVSVRGQLNSLDEDIESRINRIVSLLSSVRDSTDTSSTKVRKAKEDAIEGLKATALYYARERDKRKREMANPNAQLDDEVLARDVAALNARIETRVTQSLDIASSLMQHEEGRVERHWNTETDYSIETPEYKKAERDTRASAKIKADLAADLHASIEKLTRDKKTREAELKTATDPQRQEQLTKDIETLRQTIEARRNQIEELVTAPKPGTRPVSRKGAFEMDKMIDEMTRELKKDFAKFKSLVIERDAALARVKPLKARLENATARLEAKDE